MTQLNFIIFIFYPFDLLKLDYFHFFYNLKNLLKKDYHLILIENLKFKFLYFFLLNGIR